jgi:transmembrane sensor
MTSPSLPRKRSQYLIAELTPARIARQWSAIDAAPIRKPWPRWIVPSFSAAAVIVMAVLLVLRVGSPAPASVAEGALLESGARHAITLADGSRVTLDDGSRVRLATSRADAVALVVESGGVELDVVHRSGRSFVVSAGKFDVRIVGTKLHVVLASDGRVVVSVSEGKVEVRSRESSEPPRFVGAGESWSSAPAPAPSSTTASADDAPLAPSPASPGAPSSTTASTPDGATTANAAPPSFAAQVAAAGPKELLDLAKDARVHGRARDSAIALDALRRRYRGDARAGLAAFELGRLRMDSFGDPRGALEAFDDAIALSPGGSFREDAEARRVALFDAMGGGAACVAARDAYLARYPSGAHAGVVTKRCGGR